MNLSHVCCFNWSSFTMDWTYTWLSFQMNIPTPVLTQRLLRYATMLQMVIRLPFNHLPEQEGHTLDIYLEPTALARKLKRWGREVNSKYNYLFLKHRRGTAQQKINTLITDWWELCQTLHWNNAFAFLVQWQRLPTAFLKEVLLSSLPCYRIEKQKFHGI